VSVKPFRSYREVSHGRRVIQYHFHAGQIKALESKGRTVLVLAGTQGGKTVMGPVWLLNEIKKAGPGDYLAVAPTYPLMQKKMLPEFKRVWQEELRLGEYVGGAIKEFRVDPRQQEKLLRGTPFEGDTTPTRVLFGHAQDPDSLESMTAKGAWLDEAGQKKFKLGSYEAIQRRLSIHSGRQLITTTPYYIGWLKTLLHDRAGELDPDTGGLSVDLVRFQSIDNPAFPLSVWNKAKRDLPAWKFRLFYEAIFTRPAGIIYDCFNPDRHVIRPCEIPDGWQRYLGVDFGGLHTAAMLYALNPESKALYAYAEYFPIEKRTIREHVIALKELEPRGFSVATGGAASEDQWRYEFGENGLGIDRPRISPVEVGIDYVYATHKRDKLFIFNTLSYYLKEKESYSRKLDDTGQPTEEIEDKHSYHLMDAERYILSEVADLEGEVFAISMRSI
jgi:hypothetical protein